MFCQLTLKEVLSKHVVVKVRSNNGCFVTWLSGNLFQYIFQDIFATLSGRLKDNRFSCHLNSWSSELYQDIFLLAVVFNVETNNGFFCHLDFFSLKISPCWCGVVFKTRGDFLCFEFVFQDICLLAVVFKTRKGFLLPCFVFQYISLSVWCGDQNQKRLFVISCFVFQYISLSVWCGVQNQRRLFVITSRHLRRTPISAS